MQTFHSSSSINTRSRRNCSCCAELNHARALGVSHNAQHDAQRIARAETFRSVRTIKQADDQSKLVKILLHAEAYDYALHMLTTRDTIELDGIDQHVCTISTHEIDVNVLAAMFMIELECAYSAQYAQARKQGYNKHFASFIQFRQSIRDGRTLDDRKTIRSNYTHALRGNVNAQLHDSTDIEDIDEHTDYLMLFDTARDYRFDEEHERRAEAWQRRNGI